MRLSNSLLVACAVLLCALSSYAASEQSLSTPEIPLTFEQNRGQAASLALFLAQSAAGKILLGNQSVSFFSDHHSGQPLATLRLGDRCAQPVAEAATGGVANYYLSSDATQWLTNIPLFARIRYANCFPGIDAVFHGRGSQLEYDFRVSPGANPSEITFRLDAPVEIQPDGSGGLTIVIAGESPLHLLRPIAYQLRGDVRQPVDVSYLLSSGNTVSFSIGDYDPSRELIIDPVVAYAGYLPANVSTVASAAIDPSGNLIVTGASGSNVGVVKIDPTGSQILYSTTIGTSNTTGAYSSSVTAFALDPNGNAYVTGETSAPDFPFTSGGLTACNPNCAGGYIAKFAPNGSLVYATTLSGGSFVPSSLAADASGSTYLAGNADSSLATVNAFQPTCINPCSGAFYAKLNPAGTNYVFASFFSGPGPINNTIRPLGIALDANGNIFLAGETNADPPLVNPWQSGTGGIFIAKFAPDGKTLLFSTRFGSSVPFGETAPGGEIVTKLVVAADGTVYVVGATQSQDFPFSPTSPQFDALQSGYPLGDFEIFAFAIDPTLTKLLYSDYLGAGYPLSAALGANNHLYVSGMTLTSPLPLQNPVISDISTGGFYTEIDSSGNFVTFSQFGGHVAVDVPTAITVDSSNNVYLVGSGSYMWGTPSPVSYFGFPGQQDAVMVGPNIGSLTSSPVAKLSPSSAPQISLNTQGPYLTLRNVGSADLHISNLQLSAGLSNRYGNCGSTVVAATSCILTVTDSNNFPAAGTVTITSDATPSVQTFNITVPPIPPYGHASPIADQLWAGDPRFQFPPQLNNTRSAPLPMTIWNVGASNATINSIAATGSLIETDNCGVQVLTGAVLAPGAHCDLQLYLTPGGTQAQLHFIYDGTRQENDYAFYTNTTQKQLLLSTNAINFGTQQVNGVAIPRVVVATNTGDTSMPAPTVSLQGDPTYTLVGNTCAGTLAPHQSCLATVKFVPTVDQTPSSTLQIGDQQVQLTGGGQIGTVVRVSPLELDFPDGIIGYPWYLPLTLSNTSTSSIGIASMSFSLPEFTETDNCNGQIPAMGSCTLQVTFAADKVGTISGFLTIGFSGNALMQVITINGTGLTALDLEPPSLDFGSTTALGTTSAPMYVEVGNGRIGRPQAYTLAVSDNDFSAVNNSNCPNPIPAYTACGIQVNFKPQTPGTHTGTLTLSYPGLPGQNVVTLTGATPDAIISVAATANFGSQIVASTTPVNVAVTNAGYSNLTISSLSITGTNAADFAVTPGQCPTIAAGASCNIQVKFTPSAAGNRSATLTLTDNAPGSPHSVALSGTGTAPFTVQTGGTQPSLTVSRGTPATLPLTISAASGFSGTVQFSCAGAPANATCTVQPTSVNFSGATTSATVSVTVNTTAPTSAQVQEPALLFASLSLVPLLFAGRRKFRIALLASALVLSTMAFGCGGGGNSATTTNSGSASSNATPAGQYMLTITASSSTQTQTLQIPLTVQ